MITNFSQRRFHTQNISRFARRCVGAVFAVVAVFFFANGVGVPRADAGTLNPRGVPDGAVFLVHLDFDAARRSDCSTNALSLCEASVPEIALFKRLTGVNLFTDVSSATLSIPRVAPRPGTDDSVSVVAILRGQFDPQKIFAAAQAAGCPSRRIDDYTFVALSTPDHPQWKLFLAPLGAKSLAALTDIKQASAVIAAHRGQVPSLSVPAELQTLANDAVSGVVPLLSAFGVNRESAPGDSGKELPKIPQGGGFPPPGDFFLVLADDGQNLRLRASGDYANEATANRSRGNLQSIVALLRMLRASDESATTPTVPPESRPAASSGAGSADSVSAGSFARLLDALRLKSEGRTLRLELDYPAGNLAEILQKADARKRAQHAKSTSLTTSASNTLQESSKPKLKKLVIGMPQVDIVSSILTIRLPNVDDSRHRKDLSPEIMVPAGVHNLAKGKKVTSSDPKPVIGELGYITDGDKDGAEGYEVELKGGSQWVQIDLEKSATIYAIQMWHFHRQLRIMKAVTVQISDDPDFKTGVTTVFNNDYANVNGLGIGKDKHYIDANFGKLIHTPSGVRGRYVRLYSAGDSMENRNYYIEVEVYGETYGETLESKNEVGKTNP